MNILSIGNSFAQDTMEFLPAIAADLEEKSVFAYLYIGGCPIVFFDADAACLQRVQKRLRGKIFLVARFQISNFLPGGKRDFLALPNRAG